MNASSLMNFPIVEGFILTEILGSGSYATVYKAFRKQSQQRQVVAIKCIKKNRLTKSTTENLLKEIEILKTLHHEFIVELKDFVWDDQHIFLILEYCGGGDLSEFIKRRQALPQSVVKRFLQQQASALQYLHERDISHMDLKPHNLLLSNSHNPVLKIADFGFAQHLPQEESTTSLRGSPLYMAPEIICERRYSAKCDLWSVGVIMYECLFGKAPYASRTYAELADKIASDTAIEIPASIHISGNCRDLLTRLLVRDPNQRLSFEQFFAHPFIDLEHMPSPECINKAKAIVTNAVKCDQAGEWKSAIQLYTQSLQYFLPAIQYEPAENKKDILRNKAQEYIHRAEALKALMKPKTQEALNMVDIEKRYNTDGNHDNIPLIYLLVKLANGHPKLQEGLQTAQGGYLEDSKENYEKAFKLYGDALGQLLPILKDSGQGKKKELLGNEIKRIMDRAEELKLYLEVRKMAIVRQESLKEVSMRQSLTEGCVVQ